MATPSWPYVLLVASERAATGLTVQIARAWVDAGAAYICAWGPDAADVEACFDYAAILPELGEPVRFTSHPNESLHDALHFAFQSAQAPEDLAASLHHVVMLVDSDALEQ